MLSNSGKITLIIISMIGISMFFIGMLTQYVISEPYVKSIESGLEITQFNLNYTERVLNTVTHWWTASDIENTNMRQQLADIGTLSSAKHLSMMETDGKSFIRFSFPQEGGFQQYGDLNDTKYNPEGFDSTYDKVTKLWLVQTREAGK